MIEIAYTALASSSTNHYFNTDKTYKYKDGQKGILMQVEGGTAWKDYREYTVDWTANTITFDSGHAMEIVTTGQDVTDNTRCVPYAIFGY